MHRGMMIPLSIGMTSLAVLAVAGTAHFESGPDISDNGTTLTVGGTLSGLDPRDLVVEVQGGGTAAVTCMDPRGHVSPGQVVEHWEPIKVSGTQTIPASYVIGGRAPFSLITLVPRFDSARDAGCSSDESIAEARDVVFGTVTVLVKQGDRVLLRQTVRP